MSGRILHGDSREGLKYIEDETVELVITSPPYNVGIEYDEHDDLLDFQEWKEMVNDVLTQAWRKLVVGGRMAVNIQHSYGRKPLVPLGREIELMMMRQPHSLYRGCIIWDKGAAAGSGTAWGTWASALNPVLRGEHEMIYVFSKVQYALPAPIVMRDRHAGAAKKLEAIEPDIKGEEFHAATIEVWREWDGRLTVPESFTGHPAAFPVSLARRLIQLYSWETNTVLDPFFGSGSTGLAAEELGRKWIGLEISEEYCELASRRIAPFEGMEVSIERVE